MKKPPHLYKKILIGIIALAATIAVLSFFYQYSERSSANTVEIPVEFSKAELEIKNGTQNNYVEINLRAGTNKLSGATVLMSYPKDIVTATIDPTYCKNFDSNISTQINQTNGTISITRVSLLDNDEQLPTGIICFARINFEPKVTNGNGVLAFVDGPIDGRYWEIVGTTNTYTATYSKNPITISIPSTTPTNSPTPQITTTTTITPSPTINPSVTPTTTPSPTPTITLSPIPTQTPPPETGTSSNMTFNIRIQGMTANSKTVKELPFKISLLRGNTKITDQTVLFTHSQNGIWTGSSNVSHLANLQERSDYTVLIKGPKHLQKKICTNKPTETVGGQYKCSQGEITLNAKHNTLDFTGITLLAGDIPVQNGIVDAVDIAYIRNNLGKSDADILARGDLNYDGIVDSQDYGLIINALSFKYDEVE